MSSQSLPSFAQAFSALDDRDRALPPIHSHSPYLRHDNPRRDSLSNTLPPLNRKRARDSRDSPEPESPRIVKQEQDIDQLEPSPPPPPPPAQTKSPPRKAPSPARPATRARQQLHLNTNVGNTNNANNAAPSNATATNILSHATPPPPATHSLTRQQTHPSKRRRVTISGAALPNMSSIYSRSPAHSNAHTPPPATHTGPSTPISPVVMGFTIHRDPQAVEQVRAMLAVKQKQKALIESRRGSAAGLAGSDINSAGGRRGSTAGVFDSSSSGSVSGRRASVAAPSVSVNIVNPTPTTATGPGPVVAPPLRRTGSSPNGHRLAATTTPPSLSPNARANANRTRSPSLLGGARAKSPSPHVVGSQQATQLSSRSGPTATATTTATSNLSPPSTSASTSHHPQANPHPASTRTHVPSPPHGSSNNSSASTGNNGSSGNISNAPAAAANAAPPSSSSSPPATSQSHANASPNPSNPSQGPGGTGLGSVSTPGSGPSQNQPPPPPPQQQAFVASQGLSALAHNLPPPPTSFTKRRAGLRGNKPADLMISPRDSESGPPPSGLKERTPAAASSSSASGPQQQQQQHQHSQRQHPPPPLSTSTSHSQTQSHGLAPIRRTSQMPSIVPVSAAFKSLQPSIQSAPPRPGQQPGRFPTMALPSLPPILHQTSSSGGQGQSQRGTSIRKAPGQVPPTPTRLSIQRAQGTTESASVRLSQPTSLSRVPRTATGATFAIPHRGPPGGASSTTGVGASSSLVLPSTPATFHRPSGAATRGGGSAEKAAFLAPFEQFYDALSDAQVLKGWFSEQLRRVGALAKESEAQLAKLKAANNDDSNSNTGPGSGTIAKAEVENLVREAIAAESRSWRDEVARLRAQVAELQDLLLHEREKGVSSTTTGGRPPLNGLSPRPMFQPTPPTSTSGTGIGGAGYPAAPGADSSYTFPPASPGNVPGRPPTAPASTYHHHHQQQHQHQHHQDVSHPSQHHHHQHHQHSSSSSYMDDRGRMTRQYDRDRERGREMSAERSLSRSAASSPVPSLDSSGLGGGIARRLSVSAIRFEKLERVVPKRGKDRDSRQVEESEKEREKEKEKETKSKSNPGSGPKNGKSIGNGNGSAKNQIQANEELKAKEERKGEVEEVGMDES